MDRVTAKEVMVSPVITVTEDDNLETVATRMVEHQIGCVPVLDARGQLAGIITQSDFAAKERGIPFSRLRFPQGVGEWISPNTVEQIYEASRTCKAREVMSSPVATVTEHDTLHRVLSVMLQRDINHIRIVRAGTLVGIVSRFDLLKMMLQK
jgi:CBS domain-containing protein